MKVRQDAWSHEDDLLLAETVLRHIREGGTQLKAFDEVGRNLNRTAAACGFRWNAEIRQKYENAIEIAKKQRKERKRALAKQLSFQSQVSGAQLQGNSKLVVNGELNLDHVIAFLQDLKKKERSSQPIQQEQIRLQNENKELKNQYEKLKGRIAQLEKKNALVQEDYQSLIQIMDRARKMVFINQSDAPSPEFMNQQESV